MTNTDTLPKIKESLQNGNLCILPTDTILGIFANATHHEAVLKIFTVKQRCLTKPLAIFLPHIGEISKYGIETQESSAFAKVNLPGSYTILLHATEYAKLNLSPLLISNEGKIGIRIPNQHALLELSKEITPCGTSVNVSGQEFAKDEIPQEIAQHTELFYTASGVMSQAPSTIIDFTTTKPTVLR